MTFDLYVSGQTALIQLLKESHLFQQPDFIKLSISKAFQINTDSKLTLLENLYVLTDDSCPDDLGRSILAGNIRNTIIDEGTGSTAVSRIIKLPEPVRSYLL